MTKKQRIRYEMQKAVSANAVGAARTADLLEIRQKYWPGRGSTADLDRLSRFTHYIEN